MTLEQSAFGILIIASLKLLMDINGWYIVRGYHSKSLEFSANSDSRCQAARIEQIEDRTKFMSCKEAHDKGYAKAMLEIMENKKMDKE